ncbi:MAG: class II D-tagatose-bisphosphate aldolase non-catalytic subunit, partial [Candidatus Humimicrobiaceae bacterium]
MGIPIVELLLKKLDHLSKKENIKYTLFAACPNSYNVMVAALRSAKRANAPIKFAATLNQVDLDGGYTNWT